MLILKNTDFISYLPKFCTILFAKAIIVPVGQNDSAEYLSELSHERRTACY